MKKSALKAVLLAMYRIFSKIVVNQDWIEWTLLKPSRQKDWFWEIIFCEEENRSFVRSDSRLK